MIAMTTYRVTDIYEQPGVGLFVEITDDSTSGLFGPFIDKADVLIALVELCTIYDLEVPYQAALAGVDPLVVFYGTKFSMEDPHEVTCGFPDGDTGALAFGHGSSAAKAIADLVRSQGFRSKLADDPGATSLTKWLADFAYGFNRASEDQLMMEMEAITTPTKGTW